MFIHIDISEFKSFGLAAKATPTQWYLGFVKSTCSTHYWRLEVQKRWFVAWGCQGTSDMWRPQKISKQFLYATPDLKIIWWSQSSYPLSQVAVGMIFSLLDMMMEVGLFIQGILKLNGSLASLQMRMRTWQTNCWLASRKGCLGMKSWYFYLFIRFRYI